MLSFFDIGWTPAREELLVNLFIAYVLGLFIVPVLPKGRFRALVGKAYAPMVYLGLWYHWSMYAPEAPQATWIAVAGAVYSDGTFEPTPLAGFDDSTGFGKALGLRMIAFQWAVCGAGTDYMKPALCEYARRRHPGAGAPEAGDQRRPIAFEIRSFEYPAPPPGVPVGPVEPEVRMLCRTPVSDS